MASRTCPYCNTTYLDDKSLIIENYLSYRDYYGQLAVTQYRCPSCEKVYLHLFGYGDGWGQPFGYSFPPAAAMYLPDYIPTALRQDYLEAVQIADLSPKASATLARRCLQGMIHDFWGIKEKNLNAEITALKEKIPQKQWDAIDAMRKIGNIGAHMEKDVELIIDVDPDEAKKLLKVIELLFKNWYIAAHDDQLLYDEVSSMAAEKEEARSAAMNPDGQ